MDRQIAKLSYSVDVDLQKIHINMGRMLAEPIDLYQFKRDNLLLTNRAIDGSNKVQNHLTNATNSSPVTVFGVFKSFLGCTALISFGFMLGVSYMEN